MTPPKKIKVNSVRVGDRTMSIEMKPGDNGDFPPFVKVDLSASIQGTSLLSSSGSAAATSQTVVIPVAFTGSNWPDGSVVNYTITAVFFSSDNMNWVLFTGTLDGGSGSGVVQRLA